MTTETSAKSGAVTPAEPQSLLPANSPAVPTVEAEVPCPGYGFIAHDLEGEDYLKRSWLVDHVVSTIVESSQQRPKVPFSYGLFGDWGTGKSWLMQRVRSELKHQGFLTVEFDLWEHHQDVSPVVGMLQAVQEEHREHLPTGWRLFEWLRAHVPGVTRNSVRWLVANVFAALGSVTVKASQPADAASGQRGWDVAGAPVALGQDVKALDQRRSQAQQEQSRLKKTFQQVIAKLQKIRKREDLDEKFVITQTAQGKFSDEIKEIVTTLPLVFFLDNLDRCDPDVMTDLLEKIKLFLDVEGCVIVLAADEDVLRRALKQRYRRLLDLRSGASDSTAISSTGRISVGSVDQFGDSPDDRANGSPFNQAGNSSVKKDSRDQWAAEQAELFLTKLITFRRRLPPLGDQEYRAYLEAVLAQNFRSQDYQSQDGAPMTAKEVLKEVFPEAQIPMVEADEIIFSEMQIPMVEANPVVDSALEAVSPEAQMPMAEADSEVDSELEDVLRKAQMPMAQADSVVDSKPEASADFPDCVNDD
ncbi:MAG: KAP family NTPase [Propionibacteriaceae bacterium]|nr:KAP family NTPase [Propionibacteriaceae bacterium]